MTPLTDTRAYAGGAVGNDPHYSMVVQWDPRDSIYVVTVPELDGCMTHGSTYEEAVRLGQDAIATWIEGACEDGEPLPPPTYYHARDAH